jgi:hypothetical protein
MEKAWEEWDFHPLYTTEGAIKDFISEVQLNKQLHTN